MSFESYSGLGYQHQYASANASANDITSAGASASGGANANNAITNTNTTINTNPGNSIDKLMKNYMTSCVDYHEHQLILEDKEEQSMAQLSNNGKEKEQEIPISLSTSNAPLHFVPAAIINNVNRHHGNDSNDNNNNDDNGNKNGSNYDNVTAPLCDSDPPRQPSSSLLNTNSTATINSNGIKNGHVNQDELQKAIDRAKAIAQRLATSTHHHNYDNDNNSNALHGNNAATNIKAHPSFYPYAQKRHEFLTIHHQKLHKSYIQNLDYIAQRDETQLQLQRRHLHSIQQQNQRNQLQSQQLQLQLQQKQHQNQNQHQSKQRHPQNQQCSAGIGTRRQRNHQYNNISSSFSSCGVYITGLPTCAPAHETNTNTSTMVNTNNDEVMQESELESMLHQLFASYGKVSSVKLYRMKSASVEGLALAKATAAASMLKGDGLILYDWSLVRKERIAALETDDVEEFLDMVCLQVSRDFFYSCVFGGAVFVMSLVLLLLLMLLLNGRRRGQGGAVGNGRRGGDGWVMIDFLKNVFIFYDTGIANND